MKRSLLSMTTILLCVWACNPSIEQKHLVKDVDHELSKDWVNMIVEIPPGSTEKWEVNKATGQIEPDSLDGKPRIINYLGYPGNYGFIPKTLLPKSQGGDGDPLDILVIGNASEKGTTLRCKIIGVLKLVDSGEQDDKLIAISEDSPLASIKSVESLEEGYPGILQIIEIWFTNYKGKGKMVSSGYQSKEEALQMLKTAIASYQL